MSRLSRPSPAPAVALALVLVLLLVAPDGPAGAARPEAARFHHLVLEDGLSQSVVTCVLQDSRGFIWLGTQDGLNRYDGNTFTIFKHDPADPHSLPDNSISCLLLAPDGTMWVGTDWGGFCSYDAATRTFQCVRGIPGGDPSHHLDIQDMAAGPDGAIWLATRAQGVLRFDPGSRSFRQWRLDAADPTSLPHDDVWTILVDSGGAVWAGCEGGLWRLDPRTGESRAFRHDAADGASLLGGAVHSLALDGSGTLWVGTEQGLCRLEEGDGFRRFTPDADDPDALSGPDVTTIHEDPSGRLWVGTASSGLNLLDRRLGRFAVYRHDDYDAASMTSDEINGLTTDRAGVFWVATGRGANLLDTLGKPIHHYRQMPGRPGSLVGSDIWSILEDSKGRIWVASSSGLNRLDPGADGFKVYRHDDADSTSLQKDHVMAVYEDRRGRIWIGSGQGQFSRYEPRTDGFVHFRPQPEDSTGLLTDRVYAIREDARGDLWLGTLRGAVIRDGRTGEFHRLMPDPGDPHAPSDDRFHTIYEDSHGHIWLGSWGSGADRYDPVTGQVDHFRHSPDDPTSLSNNAVFSFIEDSRGTIWIGTSSGLNRMLSPQGGFRRITEKDGLPNNMIYGILEDGSGRLWLSTNNGLCRYDPVAGTFDTFDVSDGLQSNEFNLGAYHRGPTGRMYFGGINGYNAFYPDSIRNNPVRPDVVITDFRLFNRPVPIGPMPDGSTILARDISETSELHLSHDQDMISFEFAATHYAAPDQNLYAYILEGFDNDWNQIGNRNHATYTSLPPGEYVFRVRAANCDGVWNEEGASLRILISPPFWRTPWFLALGIFGGLGLAGGAHFYRIRLLHARNRNLESRVAERTADLVRANEHLQQEVAERMRVQEALVDAKDAAEGAARAKSEFLANMSHEIRTPMNGVLGMTALLQDTELNERQREYCDIAQASARSLLALIDDILDFSKIDAGKLELERIGFDVREVVEDVAEMLAMQAAEKGLELSCLVRHDVPACLRGDPGRLRQILLNLVNNGIKFTDEGSVAIEVSTARLDQDEVVLRFEVRDTGMGIPQDRMDRLFRSFSQVDASTTRKHGGTGLGLAIAKQLTELMRGRIGVRSAAGEGTVFWFTVVFARGEAGRPEAPAPVGEPAAAGSRALVVHPDPVQRTILREQLLHAGLDFAVAGEGAEAMRLLETAAAGGDPFRVVLVARAGEDREARELAALIRRQPAGERPALVLLTRLVEPCREEDYRRLGFTHFLQVPVRHRKLYRCLAELAGEPLTAPDKPAAPETRDLDGARILLAEDNPVNQMVARLHLQKMGFEVDVAPDGRAAVRALAGRRYAAVLMDVQMPEMDGLAATRLIRDRLSEALDHDVPIIAMTAHASREDRERCLAAGMDDYLTKPVTPDRLREVLVRYVVRTGDAAWDDRPEASPAAAPRQTEPVA